jgi:hypothetical protein
MDMQKAPKEVESQYKKAILEWQNLERLEKRQFHLCGDEAIERKFRQDCWTVAETIEGLGLKYPDLLSFGYF